MGIEKKAEFLIAIDEQDGTLKVKVEDVVLFYIQLVSQALARPSPLSLAEIMNSLAFPSSLFQLAFPQPLHPQPRASS